MEVINTLFLNLMHIMFPVSIYLLYVIYKKTYNKKENDLVVILFIASIIYITLKFNTLVFTHIPFLIINLGLIIAILKQTKLGVIFASILCIIYYFDFYNQFLIIFILLYLLYYVIYKNITDTFKVALVVMIIHSLIIFILTLITTDFNMLIVLFQIIFVFVYSYLIISVIIYIIKRAEEIMKLHMSYKEIEQDKQIKNRLFQITHEVKNPIAVCKGYLDMFDVDNPKCAREYVPIMKEEISRTLYLLEDYLAMNKVKINKDIIDINLLLEDIINHFTLMFQEKNIAFSNKLKDEEIYINGDYNRLTQVFLNLFKNSVEALKDNGKIDLWTEIKKDKVYIKIKDNGIGIKKENLKHIKEAFYTTKVRGTGLGVSLSNEIISAHDGELLYDSKEGEFTLVTVILPIIKMD